MTRYNDNDNDNDNQHTTTNNHSKKAHALLNDPAKFAIALVEIAVVADGGRPLCQACYKCEGDAPLVFKAYDILSKLKTAILEEEEAFP